MLRGPPYYVKKYEIHRAVQTGNEMFSQNILSTPPLSYFKNALITSSEFYYKFISGDAN
jgi:hypothetical protein